MSRVRIVLATVIAVLSVALILSVRHSRALQRELDYQRAIKERDCRSHGVNLEFFRKEDRKAYLASGSFIDAGIYRCVERSVAERVIDGLHRAQTPAALDAAMDAAHKAIQDAN